MATWTSTTEMMDLPPPFGKGAAVLRDEHSGGVLLGTNLAIQQRRHLRRSQRGFLRAMETAGGRRRRCPPRYAHTWVDVDEENEARR